MSLDIAVYRGECYDDADAILAKMNWLRNPFGLCDWLEDNCPDVNVPDEFSLWAVVNRWAYSEAVEINDGPQAVALRERAIETVEAYNAAAQALTQGYFYFTLSGYLHFVRHRDEILVNPGPRRLCEILVAHKYGSGRIGFDMDAVARIVELGHADGGVLAGYQAWAQELTDLFALLRDPDNKLYVSN
jgi:hypothetical protein